MTKSKVATAPARSKRAKPLPRPAPKPNGNGGNGAHIETDPAAAFDTAFDAAFPDQRQERADAATVLRRAPGVVLPGEFQDASLVSLIYTLAGAEGHTKGMADAACDQSAAELLIVRHVLEGHAFGVDPECRDALVATVDGICQRLAAAGEIERRRLEAVKP